LAENRYGKRSELILRVRKGERRSVLAKTRFTAPFKLTSPFYDEDGAVSIMLLSVSAGIMTGDEQYIDITVDADARARIIAQAFEKIHKMPNNGFAGRETRLTVGKGGVLVFSPLPVIPFADSDFRVKTTIRLEDDTARLVYSEILTCGRVSAGEFFQYRRFQSATRIYEGDKLRFCDNAVYCPAESDLEGFTMFEGYTHMASLLIVNVDVTENQRAEIAALIGGFSGLVGMTRTACGAVCIRALLCGSEPALFLREAVTDIVLRENVL
jgi:urease accessory protein